MTLTIKFILYQALIIAPFIFGYKIKNRFNAPGAFSKKLININLIAIEPLIALWAIWGLDLSGRMALLPAGGLFLVISGFIIGYLIMFFSRTEKTARATFIISSSLANHGYTMGSFLCYLFLGEEGLGLSALFISYFMPYTFLFIFPYARTASARSGYHKNIIKKILLNLQNMPLYAVITAIIIKLSDIKRPEINFPTTALLLFSVGLYYFSLGINFEIRGLKETLRENVYLFFIKFMIIPATACLALSILNPESPVKTIILIQSFMPAAIYSVVSSVLFDLDTKLATGLFVVNTIIFISVIMPAMFLMKGYILNF